LQKLKEKRSTIKGLKELSGSDSESEKKGGKDSSSDSEADEYLDDVP